MLLLDTHALVWLASDLRKLPKRAKSTVEEHAGALYISGISGLEIALAVKRGRLGLPVAPDVFVTRALAHHGITEIPVTSRIGCRSAALPDIHNDPFDRILIATAQEYKMTILSKDSQISRYPQIKVIWS